MRPFTSRSETLHIPRPPTSTHNLDLDLPTPTLQLTENSEETGLRLGDKSNVQRRLEEFPFLFNVGRVTIRNGSVIQIQIQIQTHKWPHPRLHPRAHPVGIAPTPPPAAIFEPKSHPRPHPPTYQPTTVELQIEDLMRGHHGRFDADEKKKYGRAGSKQLKEGKPIKISVLEVRR